MVASSAGRPGQGGMGRQRIPHKIAEPLSSALYPEFKDGAGPPQGLIDPHGLAELFAVPKGIAKIIGDLVSLPQTCSEAPPSLGVPAPGQRSAGGSGGKERAGFRLMVGAKVNFTFFFPALPRHNARRGPHGTGQLIVQLRQQSSPIPPLKRKPLEGQHDESVAGEQR